MTVKQSSIHQVISVDSWLLLLEVNSAAVQVTDGILCLQTAAKCETHLQEYPGSGRQIQTDT